MPTAEINLLASVPPRVPNSQAEVEKRVALGEITWLGAVVVVTGRTVLAVAAQALGAFIYLLRHHPSPWHAAAPWWSVYGTLVDIGCLTLMSRFIRKEGIGFRDFVGTVRLRWGRDFFIGVGCFALVFPFFMFAAPVASKLAFGTMQPYLYPGLLTGRSLPLWGVVYSSSLWWMIWSPTEEMTYQAYALPRIQALSRRAWVAVVVVAFCWALQHSFIPLILDWHYVIWRFFAFLPGVTVFTLIYLRTRRLPPLIVAHWFMDIFAMFLTLNF